MQQRTIQQSTFGRELYNNKPYFVRGEGWGVGKSNNNPGTMEDSARQLLNCNNNNNNGGDQVVEQQQMGDGQLLGQQEENNFVDEQGGVYV